MHQNQDLNSSLLPKTRRAILGELFKYHKGLLFNMGLILLLFSLPLIGVNLWFNIIIEHISLQDLNDSTKYQEVFSALNWKNILYLPAALIFGIGLSGVIQILHRQIWSEDIIIKADFKKCVKSNYLVVAITLSIMCLLNFLLQYLLYLNTNNTSNYKIALGIVIALCVLLAPIVIFMWSSSIIYKLPLFGHLKNSILFTVRKFYITYPLGILNIALIMLIDLPIPYITYICFFLLPLVIGPIILCINMLYCDSVFDEFINHEHFPEIYRKGMQKDE